MVVVDLTVPPAPREMDLRNAVERQLREIAVEREVLRRDRRVGQVEQELMRPRRAPRAR